MAGDALLIDLDGTLASSAWRSMVLSDSPTDPEWERSFVLSADDPVVPDVADLTRAAASQGIDVIILSGRPTRHAATYRSWLDRNDIPYSLMLLRDDADRRPGAEVKTELVQRHVLDRWNVVGALDDDPRAIDAFRKLGLRARLVADPRLFHDGPRLARRDAYEFVGHRPPLTLDFDEHEPV